MKDRRVVGENGENPINVDDEDAEMNEDGDEAVSMRSETL